MPRLFAKDLKIVAAGGDLAAATAKNLTEEGAEIQIEDTIIEELHSDSPVPAERFSVGAMITVKAVLIGNSLDDIAAQLNVTNTTGFTVKSKRIKTLEKFDLQFKVALADGATEETYACTNMQYTGNVSAAFKGASNSNKYYLPIEMLATATSELSVSQA